MQRLFSTFPEGWPGTGLLFLRAVTAIPSVQHGISGLLTAPLPALLILQLLATSAAALLFVGFSPERVRIQYRRVLHQKRLTRKRTRKKSANERKIYMMRNAAHLFKFRDAFARRAFTCASDTHAKSLAHSSARARQQTGRKTCQRGSCTSAAD